MRVLVNDTASRDHRQAQNRQKTSNQYRFITFFSASPVPLGHCLEKATFVTVSPPLEKGTSCPVQNTGPARCILRKVGEYSSEHEFHCASITNSK